MRHFMKVGCCALALMLSSGVATAQEDPSVAQEQILEVVKLQYGAAEEMGSTLQRILRTVRVTADARTNSLIVMGTRDDLEEAKAVLASIDVEVGDEQTALAQAYGRQIRAYGLEHAVADNQLLAMLSLLLRTTDRDKTNLQLALDPRQNQVIASGETAYLNSLEALVTMLDQPAGPEKASTPPGELSVRLLWLIGDEDARDVPADLKPVVGELERYGIDGLGLEAQTILRVSSNEGFSSTCSADDWALQFEGRVRAQQDDSVRLDIQVSTRSVPTAGEQPQANRGSMFDTTITTVPGHFVVLSMSPIAGMDSVFVLQLIGTD